MGIKLSNNAFGTLAASITSSATSITLTTGHGARFPSLGAGDYFYATLIDTSNNLEIVKCTARSTDVLTVTRAQEGTTARAYSAGDRIEIRLTAQTFSDVVDVTALAKKDGSNATGTWPVSVSGNAATATNAEKLGGESYTAYVRSVNGKTPGANGDVAVPSRGAAIYTSSGTFTVPTGVTSVKVRGCGGGSGGGSSPGAGGTTSFGSHCSATGGNGATPGTGTGGDINLAGGKGGITGTAASNTAAGGAVGGGCGGGGATSISYLAAPTGLLGGSGHSAGAATGYGNGGGAFAFMSTSFQAGSAGGYFEKYITGLTPGSSITVTIGAAGTSDLGGNGAPGICIVEG